MVPLRPLIAWGLCCSVLNVNHIRCLPLLKTMYFQVTGYNVEIFYWKTKPLNAFIHFQGGLWNPCLKSILKCFLIHQWNRICSVSNYFIFHYDYTLGLTLKFQLNLLVLVFSWPFSCKSAIGVIFSVADPGCLSRIRIFKQ